MKIAVYCIALNEEQFVESWFNSAKDADYLLIADTGSTDKTVEIAESLGINVVKLSIKPWRFDDARNASLAVIPDDIDYCIALDMDEELQPGWREHLDNIDPNVTRGRYKYTWNWNEDGTPGLQYGGDKIHKRHNYRWRHPVHEVLYTDRMDEVQGWLGLEIHHHADNTKPRSQYLPLLALSVKEDPYNDRNAHYYARELMYYGFNEDSAKEFKRHLELPTALWKAERAASMRYLSKVEPENKEKWLIDAINESPGSREPILDLTEHYYNIKDWTKCLEYAEKTLSITDKPLEHIVEAWAWGWAPYDYAGIAAYNLGLYEKSKEYAQKALELSPEDERLQSNLKFATEATQKAD